MGRLEIQLYLESHWILLASAAEGQSPLAAGSFLADGGGWHWGTPRLEGFDPLLKAGSREAGGLVRQVVGIGGVEVGKTYCYLY